MTQEEFQVKHKEVISKLKPIGDLIGIDVKYIFDEVKQREYLSLDGQNICTNSNSLYATENEFWGYVFIVKYDRYHYFAKHQKNVIKRYWFDDNFNQPWNE